MTIKHRMLLCGVIAGCLAAQNLPGQDAAPIPADPPPPPLIPAAPAPEPPVISEPPAKPATKPKAAPARRAVSAPRQPAANLHPGPAVATERTVNVRGQAAITSEVVTRLKRGDVVTVLEQVTLKKAKADEPSNWAKIALPPEVGVWVHSGYIDPASHAVKPSRLNLRSGPGENYSILGRIDRGEVVKELEIKGEWMKVEAPTNAYAFVAAHLLSQEPVYLAAAAPKPAAPVEKPLETVAVEPAPVVTPAAPVITPQPTPDVPVAPPVTEPPTPPPLPSAEATPVAAPEPEVAPEEPLIKRVVTREGMVRGSASIQAPTYFVLRSLGNNKTINYLFTADTNISLRAFQHQRVIITGEEILDERWPNTPVIDVESIETVP